MMQTATIQALCILLMVSVATTASADSSFHPSAPARDIPIFEEAAVPGVTDSICTTANTAAFLKTMASAFNDCTKYSDYSWFSYYLATEAQRSQLCSCELLAIQLQQVAVPRCSLTKNNQVVSFAASIQYAFQDCYFTTPSPTLKASTAAPPSPTTTRPTSAPTTTAPSAGSSNAASTEKPSVTSVTSSNSPAPTSSGTRSHPIEGYNAGVVAATAIIAFAAYDW